MAIQHLLARRAEGRDLVIYQFWLANQCHLPGRNPRVLYSNH